MPSTKLPFGKGAFTNVDAFELEDSEHPAILENLLLNDANHPIDRPGIGPEDGFAETGATSPIIGATYFKAADKVVFVTEERNIYSMDSDGTVTDITDTALEGSSRPVFATDGTYLAIAGGGAPKRWDGSGDTEDLPGSPEDCTHIVYLDGYWITFLLDDQEMRIAGPTSVTRETWDSSDFFQAEGLPDNVNALAVLLRELYVFGPDSMEIFQNFGDTTTPFQRSFFIDEGTNSPYSIVRADNTLWFLNSDREFCFLNGRTPTNISTPFDREIKAFDTVSDCWGAVIDIGQFYLIAWTFPTEGRTFVFDYKRREFIGEWTGFNNGQSLRFRMNAHVFAKDWNQHFVGDYETGTMWELSREHKYDGERLIDKHIRWGTITHGTSKRKRSNCLTLTVKRGVGALGDAEPIMEVKFKDDGKPWSTPIQVGLGTVGDSSETVEIRRTGMYKKRQIDIRVTDPVEVVFAGAEEDVDLMAG